MGTVFLRSAIFFPSFDSNSQPDFPLEKTATPVLICGGMPLYTGPDDKSFALSVQCDGSDPGTWPIRTNEAHHLKVHFGCWEGISVSAIWNYDSDDLDFLASGHRTAREEIRGRGQNEGSLWLVLLLEVLRLVTLEVAVQLCRPVLSAPCLI